MPTKPRVWVLNARVNQGWTALSRERLPSGAYITQASFSSGSIKCLVKNSSGTITYNSGALTIADIVFDALQNDARWTEDNTGYNFRFEVPASAFPAVDVYRVVFWFNPDSGEDWFLIYEGVAESAPDTSEFN